MTQKAENTLLARRFVLLAFVIALCGVALAEVIVTTRSDVNSFVVHDRDLQWQQMLKKNQEQTRCHDEMCSLALRMNAMA